MKYNHWCLCALAWVSLCLPNSSVLGQSADSAVFELDPVVVTGTRLEQQKSKVPGSVSVVTREAIEQSGHTNILPVVAAQVPGVFLNARGIIGYGVGPGSGGTISIRGISGTPNTRVLVLIDGQPQYMGIFGHPIADAYAATDVERVEVLRGAASLLYGSNALGGAINIITRRAQQEGWHGSAQLAYGSYGTGKYNGTLRFRQGKLNAMAAVNREHTDGFREVGNDAFDNTTGYLRLGYQLTEALTLSADGQVADATYFNPGTTEMPLENDRRNYLRGRVAVSLENKYERVEGALKLFYNAGRHEFTDGFRSRDVNRGFTLYQNLKLLPQNVITLGVDYKNFGGRAQNDNLPPPARVGFDQDLRIHETDVYATVEQTLWEKLSLEGGLRLINNSQYGSAVTPGAGLTYQATELTTLKAIATRGFRSPAIVDLFLFPPANENLQPEQVWNYELSLMQALFNKKLSMELSGFIMEGENLIQTVLSATPGPPQLRNTGRFTNQGIELQARYLPTTNLNLLLNYSFLDASENVLYAPRHTLGGQVHYTYRRASVLLGAQRVAGLTTSVASEVGEERYTLLNARLSLKATDWLQLFVEGNNLLDTQYQIEQNYPMPGFNVLGGIHCHF